MRFAQLAALAASFALTGCLTESPLKDTLMFPPGIDIQYRGQPAKLYGTSQCATGQLTGHTCLIFSPQKPTADGVIISGKRIHEVALSVRQDPQNPVYFLIEDQKGRTVLSTTGRHDEYGNIDIPVSYTHLTLPTTPYV